MVSTVQIGQGQKTPLGILWPGPFYSRCI